MEFMDSLQNGLDEQKPSLFEILAEQQLLSLIPPSLRYLLAVATHRNPRYLLRILNSYDEVYALISLVVERYYLRVYGGGFTENFYGLKRERVLRVRGGEIPRARLGEPGEVRETLKLRTSDIWKNLAVMVLLPYVKRKLDESYDVHAAPVNMLGPSYRDRELYPAQSSIRQRFMWHYKWFLRNIYPSVNAAYYFTLLAFNLVYLFDGTKFHSPFMWLIGTRLRRLNEADHRAIALAMEPKVASSTSTMRPGQTTSVFSPTLITQTLYPRMLSSLRIILPTSIFALKFLEWWHASDFSRQLSRKANEGLELPPPIISESTGIPSTAKAASDEVHEKSCLRRDSAVSNTPISTITDLPIFTVAAPVHSDADSPNTTRQCPICLGDIQTPTATQTGHVYCYTCIYKWVDGNHPRQEAFMEGTAQEEGANGWVEEGGGSRVGKWENGTGRDAVTGKRLLGGTSGLRRVMV